MPVLQYYCMGIAIKGCRIHEHFTVLHSVELGAHIVLYCLSICWRDYSGVGRRGALRNGYLQYSRFSWIGWPILYSVPTSNAWRMFYEMGLYGFENCSTLAHACGQQNNRVLWSAQPQQTACEWPSVIWMEWSWPLTFRAAELSADT